MCIFVCRTSDPGWPLVYFLLPPARSIFSCIYVLQADRMEAMLPWESPHLVSRPIKVAFTARGYFSCLTAAVSSLLQMSAIQCRNFVQNAWRKDLCANCFKPREEHVEARPRTWARTKEAPQVTAKRFLYYRIKCASLDWLRGC